MKFSIMLPVMVFCNIPDRTMSHIEKDSWEDESMTRPIPGSESEKYEK